MKVLYVTGDLRDGDYVEHEVGRVASNIQLELSPDMRDSMVRLDSAGRYDLVLLESQIPNGDCLTLINHIRQQNLPVAILVIIGPADEDPPRSLAACHLRPGDRRDSPSFIAHGDIDELASIRRPHWR